MNGIACAGLNDNSIVLGKHSGRHAFRSRLEELGIEKYIYECMYLCMYVCIRNNFNPCTPIVDVIVSMTVNV